mmetsp:Transcript_22749/g.40942  ORF Transcript_22749/g.40942 Transcript_22749/m.40942 type:complete len:622 (-) Transcript_22749:1731-3596(-)
MMYEAGQYMPPGGPEDAFPGMYPGYPFPPFYGPQMFHPGPMPMPMPGMYPMPGMGPMGPGMPMMGPMGPMDPMAMEAYMQQQYHNYNHPPPPNDAALVQKGFFGLENAGDYKGVIYYLSTEGWSKSWCCPIEAGTIDVSASSLPRGRFTDIVAPKFTDQICYTRDKPDSWIKIDLKSWRCAPTAYAMAHRVNKTVEKKDFNCPFCSRKVPDGASFCPECGQKQTQKGNNKPDPFQGYYMRNWTLWASNDGDHWVPLREHVQDESIDYANPHVAFDIPNIHDYYSIFMIQIDEGGNSEDTHALVMSCFELYGYLAYDQDQESTLPKWAIESKKSKSAKSKEKEKQKEWEKSKDPEKRTPIRVPLTLGNSLDAGTKDPGSRSRPEGGLGLNAQKMYKPEAASGQRPVWAVMEPWVNPPSESSVATSAIGTTVKYTAPGPGMATVSRSGLVKQKPVSSIRSNQVTAAFQTTPPAAEQGAKVMSDLGLWTRNVSSSTAGHSAVGGRHKSLLADLSALATRKAQETTPGSAVHAQSASIGVDISSLTLQQLHEFGAIWQFPTSNQLPGGEDMQLEESPLPSKPTRGQRMREYLEHLQAIQEANEARDEPNTTGGLKRPGPCRQPVI